MLELILAFGVPVRDTGLYALSRVLLYIVSKHKNLSSNAPQTMLRLA